MNVIHPLLAEVVTLVEAGLIPSDAAGRILRAWTPPKAHQGQHAAVLRMLDTTAPIAARDRAALIAIFGFLDQNQSRFAEIGDSAGPLGWRRDWHGREVLLVTSAGMAEVCAAADLTFPEAVDLLERAGWFARPGRQSPAGTEFLRLTEVAGRSDRKGPKPLCFGVSPIPGLEYSKKRPGNAQETPIAAETRRRRGNVAGE